jgi:hypothetical protein
MLNRRLIRMKRKLDSSAEENMKMKKKIKSLREIETRKPLLFSKRLESSKKCNEKN